MFLLCNHLSVCHEEFFHTPGGINVVTEIVEKLWYAMELSISCKIVINKVKATTGVCKVHLNLAYKHSATRAIPSQTYGNVLGLRGSPP